MTNSPRRFSPLRIALLSMVIYYASTPPNGWRYAIFIVPALWVALLVPNRGGWRREPRAKEGGWVRRACRFFFGFFTRGEYRQYWLASFLFWLVTLVWVSYPHPATSLGWVALCAYLACYFPLFIWQTRILWRVLRLPLSIAATLAWLAVESLRNVVFGGFSFAGLSYALYDVPTLIQCADLFGEYGVSLMIMLAGSLLGLGFFGVPPRNAGVNVKLEPSARLVSFAIMIVLAASIYGVATLSRFDDLELNAAARGARSARLALLQCGDSYSFPIPQEFERQVSDTYLALANEASEDPDGYDAIVWPEGTYPGIFLDFSYDPATTPETVPVADANDPNLSFSESRFSREWVLRRMRVSRLQYANLTARLKTPALLGMGSAVFDEEGKGTSYNTLVYVPYFGSEEVSAALDQEILERAPSSSYYEDQTNLFRRYDKVHLVLFGEYIPFAKYLPDSWEIKAACADAELGRGRGPTTFRIPSRKGDASFIVAPHICFESVVPQFITGQLAELRAEGVDPDILLNVSNDGWFRNGQETDLHLASMVFRAVENRRPLVTATHGGFSAYIDSAGRVQSKGKRGATEIVDANFLIVKTRPHNVVKVNNDGEVSFICLSDVVRRIGYVVFFTCVFAQLILSAVHYLTAKSDRRSK
ncbi:MAG: apolipoprotein N-acyltransferase [Thermoguttaceae bacterium]